MGMEGTYLNIVKAIYDQPTANTILKTERIPPKIRNKTRVSTFATIIQHSSESPSYSNQRRKRNKRNPDQKRSRALFADDMILYIENPKDSTRKLVELISEFSKVAGYKSLAFLYTNNEKSEREIKESIPITIATKRIQYLGINLHKKTKELYTENQIRSDQISRSVVSDSLQPHESQHARPPCPSPTPRVHSDSRPSSQ